MKIGIEYLKHDKEILTYKIERSNLFVSRHSLHKLLRNFPEKAAYMNPVPTLICIPDISGFTKFMSTTDIEFSARVISSLLNKIIYSNTIGLKVSEIEGDAVLFYKTGPLPKFSILIDQCRSFYTEFYKQLHFLKKKYKDHDEGIDIPEVLGLKIILHYGKEVSIVSIGPSIKLMGEDVIVAHRLLKNKVPSDEYLLMSSTLLDEYRDEVIDRRTDWDQLYERETSYKHIGDVNYSYIDLTPLVD